MTETPPDWATGIPAVPGVHPKRTPYTLPSLQELLEQGEKIIEQFLKRVVLAIVGVFTPNVPAADQLQSWASDVGANIAAAGGHITNTWNKFWLGVFGTTTGSTGTVDDVDTAAAYVTATANAADANATLALANIDDIAQAITGGYAGTTGSVLPADVRAALADINSRLEALEP